jgi:tetratricopeptide (TPR) repeat protein
VLLNAQLRIAKGDHAKAIEDLERARNTFPKMPELLFLLGRAHILRGTDDKRAEECLQQALFVQPEHAEANLLLASLQLKKGESGAAVTQLQKFLQKQPRQLRGWLLLADALRAQNNFAATLKVYDEVDKLVPNNPQTALMRGLVHLQQNKRPEARAAFLEALKRYPDFAPADEQLIGLDVVEKRFADARARVDARLRKDPENAENHLLLARVCAASDDRKGAEAALNQVIKLRPDAAIPYILLANLYLADKQVDSALAKLEEAIAKNPRNLQAHMMAATLHDTRKEPAKAKAYYEKIVELNPKFAPALNNLAYLYSSNPAELEKAFELAQKARELRPQDPNIADTLGWILYQRKQYAWAVTVLQESADKLADSAEVQYHLGLARYMVGNEDLALAALQKAIDTKQEFPGLAEARARIEILRTEVEKLGAAARAEFLRQHGAKTDDPVALARVGRIHELAKDYGKAAAAYEATLKISPKNIPVTLRLAEVHQARKETAPALELLRNARKFAPDDPDVAGALGRLSFATGEHARAYTLLQEAVQRRSDSADLLFDHARAAFAVGRQAEAETTWAAFLKVESTTPRSVIVRRSLEISTISRETARPLPAAAAQKIAEATKESPEEAVTLLAGAVLQVAANDQASAQRTLEKAVAAYPNQAQANRLLALILPTSNPQLVEKAYEFAMKARETLSEDVELRRKIAILLYLKGEMPRALSALREVAERLPKDGEIAYYEGMVLHRQKNLTAATKALQKALDLGLSPALAAEARKLLAQAN